MLIRLRKLANWIPVVFVFLVFLVSAIHALADGITMRWDIVGVDRTTTPLRLSPAATI